MKYCQNCGAVNEEDAKFCVKCGFEFPTNSINQDAKISESMQEKPAYTIKTDDQKDSKFNSVAGQVNNNSKLMLILGWISAAVSLFFIPIIFGGIGVAVGVAVRKKDESQGTILIVASVICGVLGLIIGAMIGSGTY